MHSKTLALLCWCAKWQRRQPFLIVLRHTHTHAHARNGARLVRFNTFSRRASHPIYIEHHHRLNRMKFSTVKPIHLRFRKWNFIREMVRYRRPAPLFTTISIIELATMNLFRAKYEWIRNIHLPHRFICSGISAQHGIQSSRLGSFGEHVCVAERHERVCVFVNGHSNRQRTMLTTTTARRRRITNENIIATSTKWTFNEKISFSVGKKRFFPRRRHGASNAFCPCIFTDHSHIILI